jgi:hypothetical protein
MEKMNFMPMGLVACKDGDKAMKMHISMISILEMEIQFLLSLMAMEVIK